ncbi:hypothetical protein HPB48_015292 [Haemaphysalis longicornis]|uniref:Endonuclease/exonuclease/phosphatase domain-containing protein n=1 Tax=Haemaphysalis longicornis TaxID=44386 RepID=A0A9J6FP45_HAELO|nr:hypothetical protein HPB48_015292 [Haemaphysalis longicornis]
MGDFNPAQQLGSYTYSNTRANALHGIIENYDLTLLTNPASHTCMNNSVTKDTSPDFPIIGHILHADWAHLGEYLGSGHAIFVSAIHGTEYRVKLGMVDLTHWTKLRQEGQTREKPRNHPQLTLQEWISRLRQDFQNPTKTIQTSSIASCVDARLF